MKISLSLRNRFAKSLILVFAATACVVSINAQQGPSPTDAKVGGKPSTPFSGSRYNLEIANGMLLIGNLSDRIDISAGFGRGNIASVVATLSNVVTVLREIHTNANIVLEPSLGSLKVGDLKIRSTHGDDDVQLREELLALSVASGNRFHWDQPSRFTGIDPLTGQPTSINSSSLYVLSFDPAAAANKPRRQVEVFNISRYVESLENKDQLNESLDRIRSIIDETARKVQGEDVGDANATTFDFHPGANLLIVVGPPESIEIASKVVNALLNQTEASAVSKEVGADSNPYHMDPRMMERYFGVKIRPPGGGAVQGEKKPSPNSGLGNQAKPGTTVTPPPKP